MVKTSPDGANSVDLAAAIEDARRRVAASGLKQRFMQQDRTGAFEAEQAMSNGDFARGAKPRSEDSRESFIDKIVTSSPADDSVVLEVTVDSLGNRADKSFVRNRRALLERMKRARAFQKQSDALAQLDRLAKSMHSEKGVSISENGVAIVIGDGGVYVASEGGYKTRVNVCEVKVFNTLPHIDLSKISAPKVPGEAPNDDGYALGRIHRCVDDGI